MSFESRDHLRHILAETVFVLERSKELRREEFPEDETLQRAFVGSLEVIGEAAKKLPSEFRAGEPRVDWRRMAGMRDRLIQPGRGLRGVAHHTPPGSPIPTATRTPSPENGGRSSFN